ncbi:ferritin [Kocuria palustris]|uniref:ferritin n=1 Tax=Kocuria palustris TaxID=71999 RepID=UPI0011A5A179|nr:ferritin [Kocuria palustris]
MNISQEIEAKFNEQITLEFEASLVYRQLAIEAEAQDLVGMAAWFRHQADEEIVHANKFIDHVDARNGHVQIGGLNAPAQFVEPSALELFEAAYKHEQKVSEAIQNLYRATEEAGDIDARPILNWFTSEQIEEESTVDEIMGRIRRVGDDGSGLLRIDAELSQRPARTTEG